MTAVPINEKIPVLKGLSITNKQLKKAEEANKMLLIDIETSNKKIKPEILEYIHILLIGT